MNQRGTGLEVCMGSLPPSKVTIFHQHLDILKKLSAKLEAWIAKLPEEYIKSGDKEDER
jgi:hypothetical protein